MLFSQPATPGIPSRARPSSKMTKYVECWGADKPFANITDSKMAKNIGLAVSFYPSLQSELNVDNQTNTIKKIFSQFNRA